MSLIGNISSIPFRRMKGDSSSIYPRGIVAAWNTYDKTNESADKNILKDLSGHDHDLSLMNFGYVEGSGYGLYSQNYYTWKDNNRCVYTCTTSKLNITKVLFGNSKRIPLVETSSPVRNNNGPYKIKVSGLKNGAALYSVLYSVSEILIATSDGIYENT